MLRPRFAVWMFSVGVMVLGSGVVTAQNYPNKPIRIVTGTPGSASDFASRLIAQGLTGSLGQHVIVDNRVGIVAIETVVKAPPDGYTLLYYASTLWLLPLMRKDVSYETLKDFAPITLTVRSPNILVVHPLVAANSVKELIVLAKAKPGTLNYASGGVGASSHLAGELFKAMAGVNILYIPYKGAPQALNDVIAGQVQMMFSTPVSVTPHVKSGRLRALAVTSAQPSTLVPGLPTVAASGLPGYESVQMSGVLVPAKTLRPIINRLNQEIVRVLNAPDVKEKFFKTEVEVVASSTEEFSAKIKSEMSRLGKVIKDAGIRADQT